MGSSTVCRHENFTLKLDVSCITSTEATLQGLSLHSTTSGSTYLLNEPQTFSYTATLMETLFLLSDDRRKVHVLIRACPERSKVEFSLYILTNSNAVCRFTTSFDLSKGVWTETSTKKLLHIDTAVGQLLMDAREHTNKPEDFSSLY